MKSRAEVDAMMAILFRGSSGSCDVLNTALFTKIRNGPAVQYQWRHSIDFDISA